MTTTAEELPRGVCVKVAALRPRYSDLAHFLSDHRNVLVCRRGRLWITDSDSGTKRLFQWQESPWANPYKVDEHTTLEEALALYREHLDTLLNDAKKRDEFMQLLRARRIGCFCAVGQPCHRDVIIAKLRKLNQSELSQHD